MTRHQVFISVFLIGLLPIVLSASLLSSSEPFTNEPSTSLPQSSKFSSNEPSTNDQTTINEPSEYEHIKTESLTNESSTNNKSSIIEPLTNYQLSSVPSTNEPTTVEESTTKLSTSQAKMNFKTATSVEALETKISACGAYKSSLNESSFEVNPTDWPWIVNIFKKDEEGKLNLLCGGTLVSRNVVVTSARFFKFHSLDELDYSKIILAFGRSRAQNLENETNVQIKQAQNVILPPSFLNQEINSVELAIIELDSPVTVTEFVSPVCLWDNNLDYEFTGNTGKDVGWMNDIVADIPFLISLLPSFDAPHISHLSMVENSDCLPYLENYYSNSPESSLEILSLINLDVHYCATSGKGEKSILGENGHGMYVVRTLPNGVKSWVLRGVESIAFPSCSYNYCDPTQYFVFTDMRKINKWLKNTSCSMKYPKTFTDLKMTAIGYAYYYIEFDSNKALNWTSARDFCRSYGMQLASVETKEINTLIGDYLKKNLMDVNRDENRHFWLGGSDAEVEGKWRWRSGQELNFNEWYITEPNNHLEDENCLVMSSDNEYWWYDISCEEKRKFVCELEDECFFNVLIDSDVSSDEKFRKNFAKN